MKQNVTIRNIADLLTAGEAVKLLPDTTAATLLRWGREGRVPVVRLPGRVYFRRSDIEALLTPTTATPVEETSVVEPQQELSLGGEAC